MKGIILAGGRGTRLYPTTNIISKQLFPIYNKPMIYYPLSTLMLAGIKDILIISTPHDIDKFRELLGNGEKFGICLSYETQDQPNGIAEAFLIGENFIGNDDVCLILGDNVFYGKNLPIILKKTTQSVIDNDFSTIFGFRVKDPERYGVIEFNENGQIHDIIEKPTNPPSNYAVPGIYFYDKTAVSRAENLKPSSRGELEITDLNRTYLSDGQLQIRLFGRGVAWFDTGTSKSLHEASNFINSIQEVQKYKIACIEEIALRQNFINKSEFKQLLSSKPDSDYKLYLEELSDEISSTSKDYISHLQP